jgi:solute carrier family 25 phosphate transporter 23/24/25/41
MCSEEKSGPQKRFFARYIDNVEDVREISGTSRFMSGGLGGITSQLSECPLVAMREVFL